MAVWYGSIVVVVYGIPVWYGSIVVVVYDLHNAGIISSHQAVCPKRVVACTAAVAECPWSGSFEVSSAAHTCLLISSHTHLLAKPLAHSLAL